MLQVIVEGKGNNNIHKPSRPVHCTLSFDSLLLHVSARPQVMAIFRELKTA